MLGASPSTGRRYGGIRKGPPPKLLTSTAPHDELWAIAGADAKPLSDAERLDWLIGSENVGPVVFRQRLGRYDTPALALATLPRGGVRDTGALVAEMPLGTVPAGTPFSPPQPPDRRPFARHRGGGGSAPLRLAHHRAVPATRAARSSPSPARRSTRAPVAATSACARAPRSSKAPPTSTRCWRERPPGGCSAAAPARPAGARIGRRRAPVHRGTPWRRTDSRPQRGAAERLSSAVVNGVLLELALADQLTNRFARLYKSPANPL